MRKQINGALIGTNGTGKTTFFIELIRQYLKAGKRVLICVSDDSEEKLEDVPILQNIDEVLNFKGVAKIIVENAKFFDELREMFLIKNNKKLNGALILDDARLFLSSRDEAVLRMMRKRRQLNADIYSIFHNFDGETPPSYWSFVTRAVIFKTLSSYKKSLSKMDLSSYEKMEASIKRVNAKYDENPYYFEEVVLRDEMN